VALFLGVALIVGACSPSPAETPPVSLLMIGNSYTSANDLPGMATELAGVEGKTLSIEFIAEGGWSLGDHANSTGTMSSIESGSWDYVMLQEQSVIPSLPDYREDYMFPAARALDEAISRAGAETLLYMTWGRENGMTEVGFTTYAAMQDQLTIAYQTLGEDLGVQVLPAGVAWQRVIGRDASLDLWQSDGSHPTIAGTYLVACVMYASIFEESPVGVSYRAGLPPAAARVLQEIAAEVVLDSWSFWDFTD
jgi:hypothetical protein